MSLSSRDSSLMRLVKGGGDVDQLSSGFRMAADQRVDGGRRALAKIVTTIMHGARATWAINKTWLRLMAVEMQTMPNR